MTSTSSIKSIMHTRTSTNNSRILGGMKSKAIMIVSFQSWILMVSIICAVSSSTTTSLNTKTITNTKAGPSRIDPFVTSSPLIVAAVCSDGVALIALHTAFAEEPLLLDAEEVLQMNANNTNASTNTSMSIPTSSDTITATSNATTVSIADVPRSYRGPFRIYSIDGFGTGMLCVGWRSHAQLVADYCRDLATEEFQIYGPPRMTSTFCQEYGHFLAQQTSAWMAYTTILQRHPWSCVGLLATCSGGSDTPVPGCIWLIDTTGAYRVRAHAVGGGALAGIVNQHLAQRTIASTEETIRDVLQLLSQQGTLLPSGTRAELAVISPDASQKVKLKRVFMAQLFGLKSSSLLS